MELGAPGGGPAAQHSAGREGNEGGCLGFGQPGSLSLDDLSASVGGGGALEARTLPHASVLDKDIAFGAGACIADPVSTFNVPEETDVERRAVVSKGASENYISTICFRFES